MARKLLAIMVHGIHRHDRGITLGQRVRQLWKRGDQLNLQGEIIQRLQAGNLLAVIGTGLFPLVQAYDPSLPEPRALCAGSRIELPLYRIDKVSSRDFTAFAIGECRVIDEVNPGLQTDGVDQPVGGYLWKLLRQVGLQFVRAGEILVSIERVVEVNGQKVRVDIRGVRRIKVAGRAIHGVAVHVYRVRWFPVFRLVVTASHKQQRCHAHAQQEKIFQQRCHGVQLTPAGQYSSNNAS